MTSGITVGSVRGCRVTGIPTATDTCGGLEYIVSCLGAALQLRRPRLFMYGKKQKAMVPLVCGLVLMVFPYFISNTVLLVILGVALMAIPYFVRI